jgi:hypothetical protein
MSIAPETRRFGMHPKLLMDVIERQAGSLAKAILEGVMNSVDAGSPTCAVTITPDVVTIIDDGKGITERAQIEAFFETFGQPHGEEEKKRYGTFRMGRGQMFAFGQNTWRTGPFRMEVDIKGKGLDYELHTLPDKVVQGCKIGITLYKSLSPSDLADTIRTLKRWVKYAPGVLTINGDQVNVDPADEKWTKILPDAFVRIGKGESSSLEIYNLGVHTMDFPYHRFGAGGVVVSRKQLKVNFARNDIQSDCQIWKQVKPIVDQLAQKKIRGKKTELTEGERTRLAHLIAQGEPPADAYELKVFTAVNGRHFSGEQLVNMAEDYHRRLSIAAEGNPVGSKVHQHKLCFVLATETLRRFGLKPKALREVLIALRDRELKPDFERYGPYTPPAWEGKGEDRIYRLVDFQKIVETFNVRADLVPPEAWRPLERVWVDILQRASWCFSSSGKRQDRRPIVIGESEAFDAWTDGTSYVALARGWLEKRSLSARGIAMVGATLLHEYCHKEADTVTHVHNVEFLQAYHDLSRSKLPEFIADATRRLPLAVKALKRDIPKMFLRDVDKVAAAVQAMKASLADLEVNQARLLGEEPA